MHELVFLSGARAGAVVSVAGKMVAGRSPDCHIEVPDPNASRRHAEFSLDGDGIVVRDIGSANGCFVNDVRINEQIAFDGDIIRIGETQMRAQVSNNKSRSDLNNSSFGIRTDNGKTEDLNLSMSMSMVDIHARQVEINDADVVNKRLQAMVQVSESLAAVKNVNEIYDPAIDTLFNLFEQADRCFFLLGSSIDTLTPCAVRQRGGESSTSGLTVSQSLCRAALERQEVILFQDEGDTDFEKGMSLISLNIRSAMVVPLMVREEVLGLMMIDTPDRVRSFTADDMELAATVCRQVAIAVKAALLLEQVQEEAETRRNLMRFLPKPVVDQWVEGSIDIELGGRTYNGTLFFSDVISFTRLSEGLSPEDVVRMMNNYFDRMVPCIEAMNGAIDKFMGDAIMAFWGIPLDNAIAHAENGVCAALNMQNALFSLNSINKGAGVPELYTGIGLNSGPVVAGNIGADDRLEYTVLGDTVNTAQRIESRACYNQVLVSEKTWNQIESNKYGFIMPPVDAKNKSEPVPVRSIRGIAMKDEILLHIPVFDGQTPCCIVRRLADNSFILFHDKNHNINEVELTIQLSEWRDVSIGVAHEIDQLPHQEVDGELVRSVVQFDDITLAGLLTDEPLTCDMAWDLMPRSPLSPGALFQQPMGEAIPLEVNINDDESDIGEDTLFR